MIEEEATVIAVADGFAVIEVARQSSCGQCAANKGCGTSVFANWYGKRMNQMRVIDPVHVAVGEHVIVGMKENALVKASLLVYLMPLLSMGLFAIVGHWVLAELLLISINDAVLLLFAVMGLSVALRAVSIMQRRVANNPDYQPVILRRGASGGRLEVRVPISREF